MEIDAHVVGLFLSFTLPAMVLGLALARPGGPGRGRAVAGIVAATLLHLVAVFLWPGNEAWLRSTGLMWTCLAAAAGLFAILLHAVRLRVEDVMPGELVESATDQPMAGRRAVVAATVLGVVTLCVAAVFQIRAGRLVDLELAGLGRPLQVPAAWYPSEVVSNEVKATLTRSSVTYFQPTLLVNLQENEDGGVEGLLDTAIEEAPNSLPGFEIYNGPESWQRHFDGAVAVDFFYSQQQADGSSAPMLGSLALLPLPEGQVVGLGLMSTMSDFKARRWDLILMAEAMQSGRR